ncbi:mechanosensitive ion channel family protein [Urechidicola vernalis]|uniref:Mechanosensitive ion channel n=1 Tax=Urechidicola vernalis TaxID=3075600 RepID=A0ABU2Y8F6_9FLAO|nr:mechanosensitive ion channel domain-containing protein [Urechidicola sp. P050]MDT0554322.1 mechanosensitive ion channel [Urechidicola sp. P050]
MQDKLEQTAEIIGEQIADSEIVGFFEKHSDKIVDFAVNIFAALAILIIGLYAIRIILKIMNKILVSRSVDETLRRFAHNLSGWVLKIMLFIAVASKLGVETTSFAALIAAAGLGVGFALQGALGNLAGGVIIMLFRPFKIGDYIDVQGEEGFVEDIQIFSTIIRTFRNKTIYIPNGALSNGNIINISEKGNLRLDVEIGVDYASDIKQTKEVLVAAVEGIEGLLPTPAPSVVITELADSSINFKVFLWVTPETFYSVKAAAIENCKIALDKAGIEIPYPHQVNISKK